MRAIRSVTALRALKSPLCCLALALVVLVTSAHVGSPDIWYEGKAGAYDVRVFIRPPAVVPGLADINVRVDGAEHVMVTAAYFTSGPEGAPPPDEAVRSTADPSSYSTRLWLMKSGTFRVEVMVSGAKGAGKAVVPVTASATQRLPMPKYLGVILICGALFLLFGLISIVGSAVRESLLPPGVPVDAVQMRRARMGMLTALVLASVVLLIGFRWWSAVDRKHNARLDHPWASKAFIASDSSGMRMLHLAITDSAWLQRHDTAFQRRSGFPSAYGITLDHGKRMHLFVIRDGDVSSFAHLHPVGEADQTDFPAPAPPLPAGHYHVFGDIVDGSGTARTLATTIDMPGGGDAAATNAFRSPVDADDAAWSGSPLGTLSNEITKLDADARLKWRAPSTFKVNQPADLTVEIIGASDSLIKIEPYMDMAGHAVVSNADGTVFVHLHPMGTISMIAQHIVEGSMNMSMRVTDVPLSASHISFPYAFPRAGRYRVWVQIKRNGRIFTAAHDVVVSE